MATPELTAEQVDASAPEDLSARNRLVIALLLVSTFVVILNETIMSVALPRLMVALDSPASAVQWLTTAFLLTMAVVIPITGYLIQRINTRPLFIIAMSTFCLGTLACALSPGLGMLIAGRVIQAVGTAIMLPLLMTTVMTLVPEQSRGKTMGNISIVISVAPAIGPTISGFILNSLDWRWMFWLVLPIAGGALALGAIRMKNVTTPRYAPLDFLSILLSVPAFGGIVYGLSMLGEGGGEGIVAPWIPLVVGLAMLAVFVFRQLRLQARDKALLDLRTFASPTFAIAVVMMAVCMMSLFGTIILLPIYTQNVLGMDALQTGLILLPGGLVMGLCAPFVGRLYDRFGARVLLVPGTVILSIVLWSLTLLNQTTPVPLLLAAHVTLSIGLALMFTPLFTASLGSLPAHLYSHGSAVIGTIQQVAGAAGVALFVALLALQTNALLAEGLDQVAATAGGIRVAFTCGAVISLLAIVAAFFVRRPRNAAAGHGAMH
ncbi:MFS transporter [Devosia pacifica]|uniref:MFS transporter n=1 Tax=Devosia pacifica TaxID=1335967 RepID=A0A918VYC0_9HYPH|nr:MDR family MFS transporter [Devosia pacifica]GHA36829.1 MFS transporter [Devosia pacifica]